MGIFIEESETQNGALRGERRSWGVEEEIMLVEGFDMKWGEKRDELLMGCGVFQPQFDFYFHY